MLSDEEIRLLGRRLTRVWHLEKGRSSDDRLWTFLARTAAMFGATPEDFIRALEAETIRPDPIASKFGILNNLLSQMYQGPTDPARSQMLLAKIQEALVDLPSEVFESTSITVEIYIEHYLRRFNAGEQSVLELRIQENIDALRQPVIPREEIEKIVLHLGLNDTNADDFQWPPDYGALKSRRRATELPPAFVEWLKDVEF